MGSIGNTPPPLSLLPEDRLSKLFAENITARILRTAIKHLWDNVRYSLSFNGGVRLTIAGPSLKLS
jgi:hypothetical protein